MSPYPTSEDARRRLREAQRAEADALATVTRAQAARDRLQAKVDRADAEVAAAIQELAGVSGVERAAQLLGVTVREVRSLIRTAAQDRGLEAPPTASVLG